MQDEPPEEIRKYVVEVNGTVFPPKQVLAHVTGWERQSFTTMEAQRVLNKLGFTCREAGTLPDGRAAWLPYSGKPDSPEQLGAPGTHRAKVMASRARESVLRVIVVAVDEDLKLHYDARVMSLAAAGSAW